MSKKLKIGVLATLMFALIVPIVQAQFFYRFGYGFSRSLERLFFWRGPVTASPYDKLLVFGLLLFLFAAVFLLALKKSFGESNRQIKALAIVLAIFTSYSITAGTNFSIQSAGIIGLGFLAIVFLFVLFTIVKGLGLKDHPLVAFVIALVLATILIWLTIALAQGSDLFGGFTGFGGSGGSSTTTSTGDGWFSRTWDNIRGGGSGSPSTPINVPKPKEAQKCEPSALASITSIWDNIWSGSGDSEVENLRQIEVQCRDELNQLADELEACEEDCGSLEVAYREAQLRHHDALFNFGSAEATQLMKLGETEEAARRIAAIQEAVGDNTNILGKVYEWDQRTYKEFDDEIERLKEFDKESEDAKEDDNVKRLEGKRDQFKTTRRVSDKASSCLELTSGAKSWLDAFSQGAQNILSAESKRQIKRLEEIEAACAADAAKEENKNDPEIQRAFYGSVFNFRTTLGKQYFEIKRFDDAKEQYQAILDKTNNVTRQDALEQWYGLLTGLYEEQLDIIISNHGDPKTRQLLEKKLSLLGPLKKEIQKAREMKRLLQLYVPKNIVEGERTE